MDTSEERLQRCRDATVLESVMFDALRSLRGHEAWFDDISQRLADFLLSGDEPLCMSFDSIYKSDVYENDHFIEEFDVLHTRLFQRKMREFSEKFVNKEIEEEKSKSDEVANGLSIAENISSDGSNSVEQMSLGKFFTLDLSQFEMPTEDEQSENCESQVVATLLIKLSNEREVRLVSEYRVAKLEKELDNLKELNRQQQSSLDHYLDELKKLTTQIKEQKISPIEGKWLPQCCNAEDPDDEDQFWRKGKLFDRRGFKWFVSEKSVWRWAKNITAAETFRKMLYSIFTQEKIQSVAFSTDLPETMYLAIDELLDWVADTLYVMDREATNNNPKTTVEAERKKLKTKYDRYYSNFRDRNKEIPENSELLPSPPVKNSSKKRSSPDKLYSNHPKKSSKSAHHLQAVSNSSRIKHTSTSNFSSPEHENPTSASSSFSTRSDFSLAKPIAKSTPIISKPTKKASTSKSTKSPGSAKSKTKSSMSRRSFKDYSSDLSDSSHDDGNLNRSDSD